MRTRYVGGIVLMLGITLYYVLTRAWERWGVLEHVVIVLSAAAGGVLGNWKRFRASSPS